MLDDIAYVAARALNCPIALIRLVDERALNCGFCGIAVMQDDPWVVENAAIDPRTLANPLAAGAVGLRFYAGVPLLDADRHNLGMLAVIGREPRTIRESDLAILKKLAGLAEHLLETRLQLRSAIRPKNQNPPLTSVA